MALYNLQANEVFIMNNEYVRHNKSSGELTLTNVHIVYTTKKGTFKTSYVHELYPINQIKDFNGKPQVKLGKNGNVDIQFINGLENFEFWNNDTLFSNQKAEKEAARWVNAICQLIDGQTPDIDEGINHISPEAEIIAETIKGTLDSFMGALGNKNTSSRKITKNCTFCTAPITGDKGKVIRCSYCDGDQQL